MLSRIGLAFTVGAMWANNLQAAKNNGEYSKLPSAKFYDVMVGILSRKVKIVL